MNILKRILGLAPHANGAVLLWGIDAFTSLPVTAIREILGLESTEKADSEDADRTDLMRKVGTANTETLLKIKNLLSKN